MRTLPEGRGGRRLELEVEEGEMATEKIGAGY